MTVLDPSHIWLLPGWQDSDAGHWQSRWQRRYGYQRLEQHDWQRPLRGDWSARLQELLVDAPAPVVLVAHSLGCVLTAWWAAHSPLARSKVRAALLVAPGDVEQHDLRQQLPGWAPVALQPLPFPSVLVGSQNDPYCTAERAQAFAKAWGSQWVDAGLAGHINTASGLGDWDAGHALLQNLMKDN
jgi:predicted alpha/beta hydrolase family esterase